MTDTTTVTKQNKHTQFLKKWLGKFIDRDGAYGAQCVDVPGQYCLEVYGFKMGLVGGHAKNASLAQTFHNDPRRKEFSGDTGNKMRQGDIVITAATSTNKSGHIAVIQTILEKGYTVIEQNTLGGGAKFINGNQVRLRTVKRGKPPILRYFRYVG